MTSKQTYILKESIPPEYCSVGCILCGQGTVLETVYQRPDYLLQTTTHSLCFDINYQICQGCGLVFMNPQLSQECWSKYLKNDCFTTMPAQVDIDAYEKRISPGIQNFFNRHASPATQLLEIGCGDGHFLYYLNRKYGCEALGIDLSKRYCKYVRNTLNLPVENISIEYFKPGNRRFDIILSHHVFEHLSNPILAFRKAYDLLKNDGYLIIEVPSVHFPTFSIRDMFSAHNYLFSAATIRNAISLSGFAIVVAEEDACLKYVLQKTKPASSYFKNDYTAVKKSVALLLKRYHEAYLSVSKKMAGYLTSWRENNTPIAIWGAGEHSVSLFSDFDLSQCNIQYIIDSNSLHWGTSFNGYRVVSPEELKVGKVDEVLISSKPFEQEIEESINRISPGIKTRTLYS